jgi:CDP-paratose 2-epimerase
MSKSGLPVLVSGGAGFVGSWLVRALLTRGERVVVLDDLSRAGSRERLQELRRRTQSLPKDALAVEISDISDADAVERAVTAHAPYRAVFHLAAQVAVTWSMQDPRRDFLVNALGSFLVMDAVRRRSPKARCVFMSSNKVYGALEDLEVAADPRGERLCFPALRGGIAEDRPLDPETPYGVSKASGECSFRDAARTHGMETVVLRASCIYGPRQSQQEDQGWVAWFAHAVASGLPLRIFGDGRTTRDMLYVDDLVELFLRILDGPAPPRGLVLNVGGGPDSARSLLEVVRTLERLSGRAARLSFEPERPSDQKLFVTSTARAQQLYGWSPATGPDSGLRRLLDTHQLSAAPPAARSRQAENSA